MKIKLYDNPFAIVEPKVFEVQSVASWLFNYYGEVPKVTLYVYKGEPSKENEITSDFNELLYGNEEVYTVLESPGAEAIAAYSFAQFAAQVAIAIAISVVMSVLFPPPTMPSNVNRTQQSPNNSLTSRENQVRLGQRVEDIYGTVKSIPSLMMPTYNKYVNHKQKEYGYYCVGRGYYDINELKDGDTLLSSITKSGARIYAPFTSPNSGIPQQEIGEPITEQIVSVSRPEQVNGITLKALNQVQLPDVAKYDFQIANGYNTISQIDTAAPAFGSVLVSGDVISVNMANVPNFQFYGILVATAESKTFEDIGLNAMFSALNVGETVILSGFVNTTNNKTFTITTVEPSKITVAETVVSEISSSNASITSGAFTNYTGFYLVDYVYDTYIQLSTETWIRPILSNVANIKILKKPETTDPSVFNDYNNWTVLSNYTDWVTLNSKTRTQVWVNVVARGGMYHGSSGGKETHATDFVLEIEKLDPTTEEPAGIVEEVIGQLVGNTSDERAITLEHITSWVGICRVRMKRTSNFAYDYPGTIVDEVKWIDVYEVTPINKMHFGNKTTIQTISEATVRATSLKQRQLNCLASRKLPIYNGTSFSGAFDSSGAISSGTISATSKLVDILAAVCTDPVIGNDITQLDTNQVWSVQQELDSWSSQAGQFNYTFDSDTTSFEETISIIANAGFCIAYRQNGKIRLSFDRLQPNSTALFTHRNKKPNSETITRTFATDSEFDGIEFVYSDPDSNQSETIKLPLDESANKYKKIEIPGIRSFTQAWYRANREYQKLKGQRLSIETTCTTDARLLLPNSRVDVVDNTRFKSYDGEVVSQSGLILTLSRDVKFTSGSHSIILIKRDGSLDSINCSAGTSSNQVILARPPVETVITSFGVNGIRTIFSFASDSSRFSQAWLVQEIGISDGQYVDIKAINYSDNYYYYDTQPVPDSDVILNGAYNSPTETYRILTESGGILFTEDGKIITKE